MCDVDEDHMLTSSRRRCLMVASFSGYKNIRSWSRVSEHLFYFTDQQKNTVNVS